MNKIKISAVSYLNSKPFIYGLQHADLMSEIELSSDIPSVCAQKLISGKSDIGLIPVSAIPQLKEHYINVALKDVKKNNQHQAPYQSLLARMQFRLQV